MIDSHSAPDADEEVLARFVRELEEAADRDAVVGRYRAAHPHLAGECDALAAMIHQVDRTRPEPDDGVPAELGPYRLGRRIAQGGMGEVYEATEERLKRRVAVKVIRHGRIDPLNRLRFLREQLVLAKLHQTHIVPILTAGEAGTLQYFGMPYIDGAALHRVVVTAQHHETGKASGKTPTLAEFAHLYQVESEGGAPTAPFSAAPDGPADAAQPAAPPAPAVKRKLSLDYFQSVARVMADAAEALQHAHEQGILHRDLKPSNVMVTTAGQCWIIDFGLAGYMNRTGAASAAPGEISEAEPVTVSGILGTPQYMAPEQYQGKADVRSDVWGLGATLYELLTLRRAFDGPSGTEVRAKILSQDPMPPQALVANVPADLRAICLKALAKAPNRRYMTARDFAEDLRRWMRWEPTVAHPARVPRRVALWARRNKGWAAAIVAGVIALATSVGLLLQSAAAQAAVAEAKAEKAAIEKDAAEQIAKAERERAAASERELLMLQLQQFRLGAHTNGWSEEAMTRARQIAKIRADAEVRDQAAATLFGLDARPIKEFKFDASSVAFSPDGKRLLMGGWWDAVKGEPTELAKVWDGGIDKPKPSNLGGKGPVAFHAADGTALQLVANPKDRLTLLLQNVDKQALVREFKIADKLQAEKLTIRNDPTLALSPDGTRVAASAGSVGGKDMLVVWDAVSGAEIKRWDKYASALALSPDGLLLATGDPEGGITVWNLKQEDKPVVLKAGRLRIHCLAFGPNPRWQEGKKPEEARWLLASGDASATAIIWDLETKHVKSHCRGSENDIYAVAFSPDGTLLASAGRMGAKLWDVATGRSLLALIAPKHRNWLTGLAFSPDGKKLAVSSITVFGWQGGVDVCELEPGRGTQTLRGLANRVAQIKLSPDGRYLAALGDDWQIGIWEVASGKLLRVLDGPIGYFTDNAGLAFSPDGSRFALATGTEARLWEVGTSKEIQKRVLSPGLSDQMAFDAAGKKLLLARMETAGGKEPPFGNNPKDHSRVLRFRDLLGPEPEKAIAEIKDFPRFVNPQAVAPDGSYFVVHGVQGVKEVTRKIVVYEGATGKELWAMPLPKSQYDPHTAMDPVGKTMAINFADGERSLTTLLEASSGKLLSIKGEGWRVGSIGPEAKLSVGVDHSYSLFRGQEEKPLVRFDLESLASSRSSFSRTGERVAWGNKDGTVTVVDLGEVQRWLAAVGLVVRHF